MLITKRFEKKAGDQIVLTIEIVLTFLDETTILLRMAVRSLHCVLMTILDDGLGIPRKNTMHWFYQLASVVLFLFGLG